MTEPVQTIRISMADKPISRLNDSFRGPVVCKASDAAFAELQVTRAYVYLYLAPRHEDGSRIASVATIGALEVRLIDMTSPEDDDVPSVWVELYCHDVQTSIDSSRCSELYEMVDAAEDFIAQAKRLDDAAGADTRRRH